MFTVTKAPPNRFVVTGSFRQAGRHITDYRRVWTTKKHAEADAARWTASVAQAERDLAEAREIRLGIVRQYLAVRAERAVESARQGNLF